MEQELFDKLAFKTFKEIEADLILAYKERGFSYNDISKISGKSRKTIFRKAKLYGTTQKVEDQALRQRNQNQDGAQAPDESSSARG